MKRPAPKTCRLCGASWTPMPGAVERHHPGCLLASRKREAQGDAVGVRLRAVVTTTILIPFHPRTRRVLAGPWYAFDARDAKQREMRRLMAEDRYQTISCEQVTLRPWWRLWQTTPAYQITLEGTS